MHLFSSLNPMNWMKPCCLLLLILNLRNHQILDLDAAQSQWGKGEKRAAISAWSVCVCMQIQRTQMIHKAALKQRVKEPEMLLSWVPSRQQSNPFQPVFCRGHSSVPWIVLSMEKAYQGNFAEPPVRPPNRTQQTAIKDFLGAPPWPITEMWGPDALRTLHLREPGLHGGKKKLVS